MQDRNSTWPTVFGPNQVSWHSHDVFHWLIYQYSLLLAVQYSWLRTYVWVVKLNAGVVTLWSLYIAIAASRWGSFVTVYTSLRLIFRTISKLMKYFSEVHIFLKSSSSLIICRGKRQRHWGRSEMVLIFQAVHWLIKWNQLCSCPNIQIV